MMVMVWITCNLFPRILARKRLHQMFAITTGLGMYNRRERPRPSSSVDLFCFYHWRVGPNRFSPDGCW